MTVGLTGIPRVQIGLASTRFARNFSLVRNPFQCEYWQQKLDDRSMDGSGGIKEEARLPDIFTLVAGMTAAASSSQAPQVSTPSPVPSTPSGVVTLCEVGPNDEPVIQPISPPGPGGPPGEEGGMVGLQEYGCPPEDVSSWYLLGYPPGEGEPDPRVVDFYSAGYGAAAAAALPTAHDFYGGGGGGEDEEGEGGLQAVSFLTHQDEDPSLAAASLPPHTHASTLADLGGGVYGTPGGAAPGGVGGGGIGVEGETWLAARAPPGGLLGDSGYLSEWSDSPHASTHSGSTVSTPERQPPPPGGCLGGTELEEALELPRFPHEALRQLTLTDPSLLRPMPHPSLTQLPPRPPGHGGGVGVGGTRRQIQSNDVSSSLTRGQHPLPPQHPPAAAAPGGNRAPLREMSNGGSGSSSGSGGSSGSGSGGGSGSSRPLKRRSSSMHLESSAEKRSRHNQPLNNTAIRVMTDWYESHLDHPYPTKLEKAQLAAEGGITVMQVKSWFANKRNRSNNTRPKVQKKMLEEKLQNLCQQLAVMSRQAAAVDSSYLIQQLSALIRQ